MMNDLDNSYTTIYSAIMALYELSRQVEKYLITSYNYGKE